MNRLIRFKEQIIRRAYKCLGGNQDKISEKYLYSSASEAGLLYGLAKIHMAVEDGISSFCQMLLAISTPTNKLAKCCYQLFKPLESIENTIKDFFNLLANF